MNTARHSTARAFSANALRFSHGQRTVRTASRGTRQPAPFTSQTCCRKLRLQRSIRRLETAIALLFAIAICITICASELHRLGFIFTLTDSSCPVGIYRLAHRNLARGVLVEACLPNKIARYGIERGYLTSGRCASGAEPVIKILGAMYGDRVDLSSGDVRLNGIALPQSATLRTDSRGRSMQILQRGSYETTTDQAWLFGLHDARSWDSRYFGPIPIRNVIGALNPVCTLQH